jgi:hypothetical protein
VNDSLDAIGRYGEQLAELQAQEKVAQRRCALRKTAIATATPPIWTCWTPSARCSPRSSASVQVKNNLLLAQLMPVAGRRLV